MRGWSPAFILGLRFLASPRAIYKFFVPLHGSSKRRPEASARGPAMICRPEE